LFAKRFEAVLCGSAVLAAAASSQLRVVDVPALQHSRLVREADKAVAIHAEVCVCIHIQVASTVVVGVQENQGYGIGFGIPTIAFAVAILAFVVGALFKLYVKVPPEGSPFGRIWAVFKGRWCFMTAQTVCRLPIQPARWHRQ
jgi:hypothetical protein